MTMCANGLAKLIEECGELQQVAAKKLAYFDTDNHPDGSNLRLRLEEEIADVLAACDFVMLTFQLSNRIAMPLSEMAAPMAETIQERRIRKLKLFLHWHSQVDNDQGFSASPATKEPTMADERDDQKKPTIHELEAILDSDQPLRVVVAPDGQVRTEPRVSVAEAIYGTLWRSGDLNMPYELARKYALEAIGGKGSEAQRRAIDWACTNFPPPDDIDVWQIIDDAFGAALERAKEQTP